MLILPLLPLPFFDLPPFATRYVSAICHIRVAFCHFFLFS